MQPTKVDWKKAESNCQGISVPDDRKPMIEDSDDEGSAIDSEFEHTKIETPVELMREREGIRSKMLNKFKEKKFK